MFNSADYCKNPITDCHYSMRRKLRHQGQMPAQDEWAMGSRVEIQAQLTPVWALAGAQLDFTKATAYPYRYTAQPQAGSRGPL